MPKPLPYFCWYPADAETDANFCAMDDADIGFYIRCLNHAWINGGIPADPKERARVMRTQRAAADKRWLRVGKCFVIDTNYPSRLVNARQESERQLAYMKSAKASESAKSRYERTANAMRTQCERTARASESVFVSSSLNSISLKKTSVKENSSDRFAEFWARYPVQSDQQIACQVFLSLVTRDNEAEVFACLDRYLESDRGLRSPKNANNWLHDCARDGWKSNWPRPAPQNGVKRQSREDAIREALKDL